MIRVNRKPRTRPQTKGSGAAPPTVGSRQVLPVRARGGLRPAFRPTFGTCSRTAGSAYALRTAPRTHPPPNPLRESFLPADCPRKRGRRSSGSSGSPGGGGRGSSRPKEVQGGGRMESCQAEVPQMRPAHLPSEHVLLSSPADAAGRRGALLPVLGHRKPAFGACRRGPNLLRRRLGPRRLGRRRLGLAGGALRPDRHAAQPHEVGLETQPPPSPHRGRRERADRGPRRGNAQRQNLRGQKKVRV